MIGRLTNKGISEIVKSINGRIRNMLCSHLDYMSYFEDVIKETKSQIDKVLLPYRKKRFIRRDHRCKQSNHCNLYCRLGYLYVPL